MGMTSYSTSFSFKQASTIKIDNGTLCERIGIHCVCVWCFGAFLTDNLFESRLESCGFEGLLCQEILGVRQTDMIQTFPDTFREYRHWTQTMDDEDRAAAGIIVCLGWAQLLWFCTVYFNQDVITNKGSWSGMSVGLDDSYQIRSNRAEEFENSAIRSDSAINTLKLG